jgi:hypothetical protein
MFFMYKWNFLFSFFSLILNYLINCTEILKAISWLVPTFDLRSKLTFYESFHSQLYNYNALSCMLRSHNRINFVFNFDKESKFRLLCLNFK